MHTHDAGRCVIPPNITTANAYEEGRRSMRNEIANDLTYLADNLPPESADVVWAYVMKLKNRHV